MVKTKVLPGLRLDCLGLPTGLPRPPSASDTARCPPPTSTFPGRPPPPGFCLQKLPGPPPRAGPTQRCPRPHCLCLASLKSSRKEGAGPGPRLRVTVVWAAVGWDSPGEHMSQGLGGSRGRAAHPGADTVPLQKGPGLSLHSALSCGRGRSLSSLLLCEFPGHAPTGGPRACGWGAGSKPVAGLGSRGLGVSGSVGAAAIPAPYLVGCCCGGSFQGRDPGSQAALHPSLSPAASVRCCLETCVSGSPAPYFPNEVTNDRKQSDLSDTGGSAALSAPRARCSTRVRSDEAGPALTTPNADRATWLSERPPELWGRAELCRGSRAPSVCAQTTPRRVEARACVVYAACGPVPRRETWEGAWALGQD